MKLRLLIVLSFLLFPNFSYAQTLANCGRSDGKAYVPSRGIMDEQKSGWIDDKISGGKIQLEQLGEEDFDILISDVSGIFSTKQAGGKVIRNSTQSDAITFIVAYPNSVETYTFQHLKNNQNEVMWTQNRQGLRPKVAIFTAPCKTLTIPQE